MRLSEQLLLLLSSRRRGQRSTSRRRSLHSDFSSALETDPKTWQRRRKVHLMANVCSLQLKVICMINELMPLALGLTKKKLFRQK